MISCVGSNFFGQLGVGNNNHRDNHYEDVPFGRPIDSDQQSGGLDYKDVIDIQCGSNFSLLLKSSGKIFICGTLCGVVMPLLTPVDILYPLKCIQIACGRKHILALMDGGFVLSWGTGYFGQLGHGDDSSWESPRMIHSLEPNKIGCKIIQIACGGSHSAAVADNGRVFTWGLNKSGQCGVVSKTDSVIDPRPIDLSQVEKAGKAVSIVCGRNHTALLTKTGRVFVWGAATFCRLGLMDSRKTQPLPVEIAIFKTLQIASIASGDFHMLALGKDGTVYSWGYGLEGQTGLGVIINSKAPRKVEFFENMDIVSLICGDTWSMALSREGYLYAWGYGDGGWLGLQPQGNMPNIDPDSPPDTIGRGVIHTKAFDSCHNVLIPQRVKLMSNKIISKVRCGGGHTIIFSTNRPIDETPTAISSVGKFGKMVTSAFKTSSSNNNNNNNKEDINKDHGTYVPGSLSDRFKKGYFDKPIKKVSDDGDGDGYDLEREQRLRKVGELLKHEVKSEALDNKTFSWCRHKKITEIEYVLNSNLVSINIRDNADNTLLIVACQNGHANVVQLLIEHGADLSSSNSKGNTALHFCFAYGHTDIGKDLIDNGADEYMVNNDGLTCYEGLTLSDIDKL
jgi:alpha-tubulin suppressor-like RCC1 family protein